LLFLGSLLARYHRFDDAIFVHNHLLENVQLDSGTDFAVRLSRAMAMLRVDHLFDADRAIADLRKRAAVRGGTADDPTTDAPRGGQASAGLALIELYRDVKTGHSAEAIERFNATLPMLQKQLGHRVADAHALVARAYDNLGNAVTAQQHYESATLLAPPVELARRYPEVEALSGKYQPAIAPPEAA
jgi:tetratricopeptide (TPR) repeat protein